MSDHRFRVEKGLYATGSNNYIDNGLYVNSGMTVNNGLLLVNGSFTVTGNFIVQGNSLQDVNIYPLSSNGFLNVGSPSNTYNMNANTLQANSVYPYGTGANLGSLTNRWNFFATNIDATGTLNLGGNFTVNTGSTPALTVDSTNLRAAVNTVTTSSYALAVGGPVSATSLNFGTIGSANGFVANTTTVITGNSTVNTQITPGVLLTGKVGYYQNNVTVATTSTTTIDAFPQSLSRSAKLVISVDDSTGSPSKMHMIEMLVAHDNTTNVLTSKFGELYNTKLGSFDATISGSTVNITFTAFTSSTYAVKTIRQQILI